MMKDWIVFATRPAVVRRSFNVALVVGSLLVVINQGDRIVAGEGVDVMKTLLTYLVPYCVATYAAVSALMGEDKKER